MDYKKIIRNRSVRLSILRLLSFIPDKTMIKLQYRLKTGRKLNLKEPKRFTEKIQWYKLNYKNPLMIQCVDKFDVRSYVKSKGLEKILIPCYGVYKTTENLDWDVLPNSFVIKDTLGGGGTSVIIVDDKNQIDKSQLLKKMSEWIRIDAHKKDRGREWPYYSGKNHRIIIEKNIKPDNDSLIDYKFFCFNGKVEFVYAMDERVIGESVRVNIYNRDFKKIPVLRVGDLPAGEMQKPRNYYRMVEIAEQLGKDFPHVRVDLYNVDGTIRFGELTFYNASGYMKYDPDKFDFIAGKHFMLSNH